MSDKINLNEHNTSNVIDIKRDNALFSYQIESLTSDSVHIKQIKIPKQLICISLFRAYCAYSYMQEFSRKARGTKQHYGTTLSRLIDFFTSKPELLIEKDDRAISVHYFIYLRDELKKSSDSIVREFINITVILKFATDRFDEFCNINGHDDYLADLLTQMPKLQKHSGTLGPVFTNQFDTKYSDDEIIISMRRVLAWFMLTMQNIRNEYLEKNKKLATQIFKAFDNGKLPYQNTVMKMASTNQQLTHWAKYNGYHTRALLNLENPIVNEMMICASQNLNREISDGERYSASEIKREFEAMFFMKKDLRYTGFDVHRVDRTNFFKYRYNSSLLGKTNNSPGQSVFPIGSMFTSTLAERRAMAWLLASDRIQASGFDKVKLDSVMFDHIGNDRLPNELQIKFPKPRAGRSFNTPIYQRNEDELFHVYNEFYKLRLNENKYFSVIERPKYLMASKWNKLFQRPAALCQSTHLPLLLLGIPGTEIYKKCLSDVDMSKPFLEVLSQSVKSSTEYRNQRSIKKYSNEVAINVYPKAISIDLIAQSRAVMEDEFDDDESVTAESSAHSVRTHNEIYIDKSDISKKKGADIRTFGSDLGDKIYDLSKKMGKIIDEEPNYNRSRLMHRLGLSSGVPKDLEGSSELNEVIKLSKKMGLGKGFSECVNLLTNTYIVQDPTIAAIIISFSQYLDRVKKNLSKKGKKKELKLATSHQIYLQALLERFHGKYLKEGLSLIHI